MKPPSALGAREHRHELSTYRRAGVHHSQETRGTHKTQSGKGGEQREEEIQLTRHQTHFKKRGNQHHHHDNHDEKWHACFRLRAIISHCGHKQLIALINCTGAVYGNISCLAHQKKKFILNFIALWFTTSWCFCRPHPFIHYLLIW